MIISRIAASAAGAAAIAAVTVTGQAASAAVNGTTSTGHPAARHAAVRPAAAASPQTYTVHPDDTLSGIGARFGIPWQALYAANESAVGPNPNLIFPGEVLRLTGAAQQQAVPASGPSQPGQPGPAQQGSPGSAAQQTVPAQAPSAAGVSGGFQQCVIERESGGDAQVMNSTGHYGLYQFSQSAWDGAGGNPADFGHASVSEQNQVFQRAFAMWGTAPWAPSDGC